MRSRAGWLPFAVWVGVSLPAFRVRPAIDDWGATAPRFGFDIDVLRPGVFWRPVERLVQYGVGATGLPYPTFHHSLAVVGHGVSGWLVFALARRFGAGPIVAAVASALFLAHPGVVSVPWSVDGPIRAWSTALGLASVLAFAGARRGPAVAGWLALATLSAATYESGLRWFLVAPLLRESLLALRSTNTSTAGVTRRAAAGLVVGLSAMLAYFTLRFALAGDIGLSAGGRYAATFHPLAWMRNATWLLGASLSTADSITLLGDPPNLPWALLSGLLGLPLVAIALWHASRVASARLAFFALAAVAATLLPHLPQTRVSEFYVHPLVAVLAVLLASTWSRAPALGPAQGWALAGFVVAALAVDTHKCLAIIRVGDVADRMAAEIVRHLPAPPERLCVVVDESPRSGYSMFAAEPGPASGWGRAAHGLWGWDREVAYVWVRDRDACASGSTALRISTAGDVALDDPVGPSAP